MTHACDDEDSKYIRCEASSPSAKRERDSREILLAKWNERSHLVMPLTDFCTSARQSPVVVWVVRLAMGKFLRSHAACEANHATRKCSFKAVWTKRSWFIGASADYAHKNGRNHFAQILYFSIFGHIFWCNFSKTTHFWNHLAPVVWSPAPPTPIRKKQSFRPNTTQFASSLWTIPFIITLKLS